MKKSPFRFIFLGAALGLFACNGTENTIQDGGIIDSGILADTGVAAAIDAGEVLDGAVSLNLTIGIQNFAFSPSNLIVPPGGTVTVVNRDGMPHSVTSQTMAGNFQPGAVNGVSFDTGPFTGTRTFTIPTGAPVGSVIPYFCTVHLSGMANAGQITIGTPQP